MNWKSHRLTQHNLNIADAFWGDIKDGQSVNLYEVKKAAAVRFAKAKELYPDQPTISPIIEPYDPAMIRKAVFDPAFRNTGFVDYIQKAKTKLVEDTVALMRKAAREDPEIKKATDSSTALMHSIADEEVTMLFQRICPFQEMIGVEANRGKYAMWDCIRKGNAGSAAFGPENKKFVESEDTPETGTAEVKILYAEGLVTKLAQFAGQSQIPARDLLSIRMLEEMEMLKQLRERRMLGVTSDVTQSDPIWQSAGTYEYKGIYEIVKANTADPNYITCSNGESTWAEIEPKLNESFRRMVRDGLIPQVAVADSKTFQKIREGMNDRFMSESLKDVAWGVQVITLQMPTGPIPLVTDYFLPTTTGTNGSIGLYDLRYIKRRVLYPEMANEIQTGTTGKAFMIDAAEVIIDKTAGSDGTKSLMGGVYGITLAAEG